MDRLRAPRRSRGDVARPRELRALVVVRPPGVQRRRHADARHVRAARHGFLHPDPRVGLKAGLQDAGSAIWNMRMISHTPPPSDFAGITNSDLGFSGTNVIQGNYNGFEIWDIANPARPRLRIGTLVPGVAERRVGL